ncbi:helix-turn-helix domain-containing protein, partial [Klebsiella pneumoniae]|nr:helix-turn-helix domain-containing protein [Klebsiella pneumoniae]
MELKPSTRSAKGGKQTSGVYSPRSIDRLLGLLRILSENAKGKTLSELSLALQIPKSSLLTMVRPLTAKAYL